MSVLRALAVPEGVKGGVWLTAMPGRHDRLDVFLQQAADARIDEVVCLTPRFEVERLSPAYAAAVRDGSWPMRWTHLPMADFALADAADAYARTVDELASRVRDGARIVLHCAAGIGRTGTTAACLLKRLGWPEHVALMRVREAGSNPESALQLGLIERF